MHFVGYWLVVIWMISVFFGCGEESDSSISVGDHDNSESAEIENGDADEQSEAGWNVDPEFEDLLPTGCSSDVPYDTGSFDPDYTLLTTGNPTFDKNYYLLTLFDQVEDLLSLMQNDAELTAFSQARTQALRGAAACDENLDCIIDNLIFSETDRDAISAALARIFTSGDFDLAGDHLRPSGRFLLYDDLTDGELIDRVFRITVAGLYEAFDGNAREMGAAELLSAIQTLSEEHPDDLLFYEPLAWATQIVMESRDRDEAGRYEPMEEGENAAALAALQDIDWDRYPYSVILVPGQGPDTLDEALTSASALRCDLAAERYFAGLAPLILTSGGHVHPDRTPYAEAIEMKKYLMETHNIPESALLIDPHARHTTTNLRNATRLILRYGIPGEKPLLVTTDMAQSMYIAYMLDGRCLDELGYLPYRSVMELGTTDTCMLVDPTSLYADPSDPLDP